MKKGFTLIELLAVIVILAVIALIATPMILGIIETAKMGAAKSSALGYLDAIEKQIVINQVDSNKEQIQDGVYNLPMSGISVKGKQPSEGWVVVGNGEVTSYSMRIMDYVVSNGNDVTKDGELLEKPTLSANFVCKRAKSLHTEVCTRTNAGCYGACYTEEGEKNTTIIEYGNLKTDGLKSGDAFDCDVNGDGIYDSETERFYYVTDLESNTEYAVLVYYNNTTQGVADNGLSSFIAYDSSNENWHGPVTGIANLPTTAQWSNVSLSSTNRSIITERGTTSTDGGPIPEVFSYTKVVDGKTIPLAARLLTYQEVSIACGRDDNHTIGELDVCSYLMENTEYSRGYWLETPTVFGSYSVWYITCHSAMMGNSNASNDINNGIRPAIEVLKTDIEI